jgi:hypothetical protein
VTTDVLEPQHAHALRPGVVLADRFRLVRSVRGTSPFAFSYQAEDLTTGESVVVKEFFPRSLVSRAADGLSVRAHSPECERDFLRALHRYALEGATLAESTHPNLVRVRAVVDANATVYLVMNRHETQPLADYLRAAGGRMASADAGRIVQHLLSALQVLHTESIIHRDLSPRSVHVGADGSAILLEFSARRHLPLHATDLAAGFAAFEQYGMRDIGPWTDVYAVSALLYYMLTGTVPPSALDRAAGEAVVSPLASIPGVAPGLARLALKGMALLPQQRPHAVSELRRLVDAALAEAAAATPQRSTPAALALSDVPPAESAPSGDDLSMNDYDRAAPLRLAAGGIVVPGEERGVRLLRMLGGAASRLRRSMTPNPRATGEQGAAAQDAPMARAAREIEPEPAPIVERSAPAPVAPAPTFSAPPLAPQPETRRSFDEEQPRGLDLAAELALATDVMQSTTLERENSRRRYSIAAVAALIIVVGGSLVLLARSSRASGIKPSEQFAPTGSSAATAAAPSASDPHVSVESGAVQQSTTGGAANTSRLESDSPAKHAPVVARATPVSATSNVDAAPAREPVLPSARMPNLKIAVTGTTSDLKIVPPELLVDSRTRLTNGEDQAEQGEYVTARRTFRSAILQLDSVAVRFPESQAIKGLKRDLEQADARAVQACAAENDMRKRRGEQARVCQ